MSEDNTEKVETESVADKGDLNRVSEVRFTKELNFLIKESEEMRVARMMQHRTRGFITMNLSIFCIFLGIAGFGYLFLIEAQLIPALLVFVLSLIPPIFLNIWVAQPIKTYKKEHKTVFMPKLAKALNGLSFHPSRGVSAKMIERLAIMPAHEKYEAEDCFMGSYKGVKVIFSEARLYSKHHKDGPVFDGIFVLLENNEEVFDGHTIITANHKMVKAYEKTRWKTMNRVHVSVSNPDWDKFHVFSTKPESAELMVGDKLLKELAEAADVFDNAPLTAVMFGNKYVFMMIPYAHDMFEASSLFVPVTTQKQAMQCKREIEQLLEIIDVFDLYKPIQT